MNRSRFTHPFTPAGMPGAAKSCECGACADCREAGPASPAARRGALDSASPPAMVREARQAPGRALDAPTRRAMELRFGHDFGKVRIHADADAAQAAQSMAAHAYTIGDDIFFAPNAFDPQSRAGLDLLAHELAHVVQQEGAGSRGGDERVATAASHHEKAADESAREVAAGRHVPPLDKTTPSVQRRLVVDAGSSLTIAGGRPLTNLVAADPAASLSAFERLDMMDRVIAALCPSFAVDKGAAAGPAGSGEVAAKGAQSLGPDPLAAGTHATGCCCLNILVNATDTWTIHVSQLVSSFTRPAGSGGDIVLPSEHAPLDWGSYTARGVPAFQGLVPTAGHELCGHAALMQIGAHPSAANRLSSDVHDPTVRIENAISSEQGVAASQLRGLAGSGPHRGESVDRLTVTGFGGGLSDAALLPADEQASAALRGPLQPSERHLHRRHRPQRPQRGRSREYEPRRQRQARVLGQASAADRRRAGPAETARDDHGGRPVHARGRRAGLRSRQPGRSARLTGRAARRGADARVRRWRAGAAQGDIDSGGQGPRGAQGAGRAIESRRLRAQARRGRLSRGSEFHQGDQGEQTMSAFPNSPKLLKAGIVVADVATSTIQRVISLQYNPDTLTRSLAPQALASDEKDRSEALRLKGPAVETIKLEAEIDATDQLADPDNNPDAVQFGIHPQLAALEVLAHPSSTDLLANSALEAQGMLEIIPMEAPLLLFVWSRNRITPVRLTDFSITEEAFDPDLNPIRAKISLGLRVLSVDDLGYQHPGGILFMNYLAQKEQLAARSVSAALSVLGLNANPLGGRS